ncbi:di-trans,poly-cis-decaprenylcistransferase [Candidatus Woesearchaeota archaeon]|nr:di-trans,poly-cis-decaprenylcistransferase [Candidatus Woesearchaeota archaeon]
MSQTTFKHLAIILDGNRRWAKEHNKHPGKGHQEGAKRVEELLRWCKDLDIKELTLFTFSAQNFHRSSEEVSLLMKLFKDWFGRFKNKKEIKENDIQINFLGRTHLFPKEIQEIMEELTEHTKNHKTRILNFCMGYGGREEIIDAVKALTLDVKQGKVDPSKIDETLFGTYLTTTHQPQLIIRTGGAQRTSNFLIWQSFYSEWYFEKKYWPEFSKEDLQRIISEYQTRERRFGK